jgi:hypothetical protein
MRTRLLRACMATGLALMGLCSLAGEPPRTSGANEDLQPAVNTSAPTPARPAATAPSAAATAPAAAATAAPAAGTPAAGTRARSGARDRIELDTTQITGNSELPRVLYVVPWKRSDLGDLTGKPVNSLLDEVLAPVDRDVFRRQNSYYDALKPDTATRGIGGATAGEK